jgi:phosphoenolpyruvate carboxykinase (ATP)
VPEMTIIDLPSFRADPARHGCRTETVIAVDFERMLVLIGGTSYAGEMKKSVFTALNYLLPAKGVMPMHCSANVGDKGDAALFFGLSGTGKTTLSADPTRTLIGDDEHGWARTASSISRAAATPRRSACRRGRAGDLRDDAALRHGAGERRARRAPRPDFDDGSLTENTRCAYPLHFIPNSSETGAPASPRTSSC